MRSLQSTMVQSVGLTDTRPDAMLQFEQAELLALEYNLEAVANDAAAFDIYPRPALDPDSADSAQLPLRPPIVTVMGHVDHGKTTLLDTLRKTSVAQGEAGGITQHIGAFSVPVGAAAANEGGASSRDAVKTVTFLDTPGHAAFTAMRSRGASVTDIIVLVVAADDGVMPQTEEVIELWKDLAELPEGSSTPSQSQRKGSRGGQAHSPLQLVVALNKVDKPDADPGRVKRDLLARGVELEEFAGDVPCVEVSGKTGAGLDLLEETLATLAELAELRAERTGPAEGYVLESRVEKGRGNLATVLVKRGALKPGDCLIAGTSWCKVRQIFDGAGKVVRIAFPGDPVLVAGWRELPTAGDELLGSTSEADVKRAAENRKEAQARRALLKDAENINESRRLKAEDDERAKQEAYGDRVRRRAQRAGQEIDPLTGQPFVSPQQLLSNASRSTAGTAAKEEEAEGGGTEGRKELRLLVKADVSGTVEAVVGAIQGLGNNEAGVRIIASGVGEPSEGDVSRAQASEASIICFNLSPSSSLIKSAARLTPPVGIHVDTVIYRLMDHVSAQVAALLPPRIETRVLGEASVAQIFTINVRARVFRNIAGCRVTNGVVNRGARVRILRGKERSIIFDGKLDTLKHVKKDVEEMRKGTECGMAFDGFENIMVDDVIQCYNTFEVPRTL
ncbi:P-loop containing nucleoside triphosphate hydrolase protein [Tilletiaria anomala UBC 951]|uniref:Translation initiation factor IF-2, mitochondrial n=1 Tax=Tilletiaria anomala (strain ATCC 24038 / CBS 436.72 / UBC 951) TaxID=1037660 RepID=A0A066W471_TILAU|nr:P-loop containing nucleoside triphosphate hydrolase protein [Tilletiaria anomala UBC 951]KDN45590.1 P-loop containing nucleoside triphosphate hydrolase protein [Tilletiaria anomala UBC 951]